MSTSQLYSFLAARYCARIDRLRILMRLYQQCGLYGEAATLAARIADSEHRAKDCVNHAITYLGAKL